MYLVISHWEVVPGREAEFERDGKKVRDVLRSQPGATMITHFKSNEKFVVVHGYEDEAAYNRIVNDPNGPFVKALAETNLESSARWLGSEKGSTDPYE